MKLAGFFWALTQVQRKHHKNRAGHFIFWVSPRGIDHRFVREYLEVISPLGQRLDNHFPVNRPHSTIAIHILLKNLLQQGK